MIFILRKKNDPNRQALHYGGKNVDSIFWEHKY